MKSLASSIQSFAVKKKKTIHTEVEAIVLTLDISQCCQDIDLPFQNKSGISCFYVKDSSHFAAGYYDGSVSIKWGEKSHQTQMFSLPVTGIIKQEGEETLVMCSLNGIIKSINCNTFMLKPRFFAQSGVSFCHIRQ